MQVPSRPEPRTPPPAREIWHALAPGEAVARVGSHAARGLSEREAERRLAEYGANALPEARGRSLAAVFVAQLRSPLIYLLIIAAAIAFALGETHDALVILVVVTLNAVIGAFQEGRAERSLAALRRLSTLRVRVVRDGAERLLEARELVPGDVLLLAAGDAVGADARLLDAAAFEVAEAALTGESLPVAKDPAPLAPDTLLADRRNMVYSGTHVTAGRARALVVATALDTEIGAIARMAERAQEPPTPLERRIAQLGRQLVVAALAMVALVNAIGLARGLPFAEIFMIAISQMVSMVPEGLPVAMTVALAVGVQRMARRGALVRRLAAVEVLGSTTVICSDKTGTLTRNEMTATAVFLPGGRTIEVTGAGHGPEGGFAENGCAVDPARDAALAALLEAAALCNDAQLLSPGPDEPAWRALGDPTEAALLTLAHKGGLPQAALAARLPRCAELPFDSAAKMMATQHAGTDGPVVFVKGAPEMIEELCTRVRRRDGDAPLGDAERAELRAAADAMASRALRLLAIARVDGVEIDPRTGFACLRGRATLLGLVGQMDPPRAEAAQAARACAEAGIRAVMVTGDHKATGLAVARMIGIAREGDLAVDGRELEALSDAELAAGLERISVFARVHPAQKLRIVGAYQARGDVVAMTGDGVNDAPALAQADVGVAMGITGTEVAKQAAKIVVTDDDFATIVGAVAEGRLIYRNIKKLILYLFSTSVAEILVLTLALVAGYPPPLAAVQILWINLVTDGVVTVNLVMDPPEGDEMRRAPVPRDEPVLTRALLSRLALFAPTMALSALGWFALRSAAGVPFEQVRTETFTVLAVCQWFNVLNCRSELRSALDASLLRNPWLVGGILLGNVLQAAVVFWEPLGRVFHTVPIPLELVPVIGLVASPVLWVEELRKWRLRRRMAAARA
ncbi:MAG: haloacid dehalogenase [Proteobacteria bacterium]|nr:MAG: haloacid dehalogenase [Pseudomonadota bacterium]